LISFVGSLSYIAMMAFCHHRCAQQTQHPDGILRSRTRCRRPGDWFSPSGLTGQLRFRRTHARLQAVQGGRLH
jgi:hypothetical protein